MQDGAMLYPASARSIFALGPVESDETAPRHFHITKLRCLFGDPRFVYVT